jgi:C4-dicarboxylate-specific signal transduction histidine kinase
LARILESLLLNACQHGSPEFNTQVLLTAQVKNGLLTFTVEDNGGGVAKEFQERMFRPFATSNRTQGNKGLGLSVVYNLVYFVLAGRLRYFTSSLNGAGFIIECPYAH